VVEGAVPAGSVVGGAVVGSARCRSSPATATTAASTAARAEMPAGDSHTLRAGLPFFEAVGLAVGGVPVEASESAPSGVVG